MRSIFYSLLSLATVASTLAVDTSSVKAAKAAADDDWDEKPPETIFNGQTVPPMIELRKDNIKTELSKGNWYVLVAKHRPWLC